MRDVRRVTRAARAVRMVDVDTRLEAFIPLFLRAKTVRTRCRTPEARRTMPPPR
jgi:hypothetical protein